MIFGEHIVPQSEMIKAILFEDSPCCGGSHLKVRYAVVDGQRELAGEGGQRDAVLEIDH